MHLHRIALSFCLLLIASLTLGAPSAQAQIENSGFPVLQLEPSARTAALAGSATALLDNGSGALFSNPALLTAEADGRIEFSYLNHLSDIDAGWVAYGKDMGELGSFGAGIRYLSFGQFDERNELGEKVGSFSAADVALTVGGARTWKPGLRYGAALSIMHASIAASSNATGIGLDAGLVYDDSETGSRSVYPCITLAQSFPRSANARTGYLQIFALVIRAPWPTCLCSFQLLDTGSTKWMAARMMPVPSPAFCTTPALRGNSSSASHSRSDSDTTIADTTN